MYVHVYVYMCVCVCVCSLQVLTCVKKLGSALYLAGNQLH
jgi:hypothetical protein